MILLLKNNLDASRQCNKIFKNLGGNKFKTRILYQTKLPTECEGTTKTVLVIQGIKVFTSHIPQEVIRRFVPPKEEKRTMKIDMKPNPRHDQRVNFRLPSLAPTCKYLGRYHPPFLQQERSGKPKTITFLGLIRDWCFRTNHYP